LSDQPGDPHSPHDGTLWSHIIWCIRHESSAEARELHERWSPDLIRDPVLRFLDKTFILWHVVTGLLLYGCGYAVGGASFGISLVTWGLFARLVFVLHSTWLVNSASHMWGYRNYETTDDSRNNWWVALLTYGEGWHNNHHAFPRMARHGHRWWEVDITFLTIWLMKKVGLAWEIVGDQTGRSSVVRTAPAPDNRSNLDSLNRANHRPSLRRSDIQHRERSESGEG
jgi:stearoyl-CoA desaturase (delta-9 desaturase)